MNYNPSSERSIRQLEGVQKWVNSGCKSTLQYCTGFGKTWVAILCIKRFLKANPMCKVDVVVPTTVLKDQWTRLLDENGLSLNCKVWVVNTATKKIRKTDFLVIDEIHRFASDTFFKIFEKFGYSMVLGLTATFDRLDGKEFYISKYCPVVDVVTIDEATQKGWLAQSKIYKVLLEVDDIGVYNEYNRQFMSHFAFFDFDFNTAMGCVSSYDARVNYSKMLIGWNEYYDQFNKDRKFLLSTTIKECTAEAFAWNAALKARKEFVHHHPKKLEIAQHILDNRRNSKAITFCATIKDCEKFQYGYVVHSGKTKKKNALTLEEFNSIKTGVIHSSKALTEGVDVKGLNLAIILYNSSSSTERIQKYGRVIRAEEGKVAEIFSLVIKGTVEENWFKKSAKNTDFIEISESELEVVLDKKSIDATVHKQEDIRNLMTY